MDQLIKHNNVTTIVGIMRLVITVNNFYVRMPTSLQQDFNKSAQTRSDGACGSGLPQPWSNVKNLRIIFRKISMLGHFLSIPFGFCPHPAQSVNTQRIVHCCGFKPLSNWRSCYRPGIRLIKTDWRKAGSIYWPKLEHSFFCIVLI